MAKVQLHALRLIWVICPEGCYAGPSFCSREGSSRLSTILRRAEVRCPEARVHGAHASPTSGSWPTVVEKRTFRKVFRSWLHQGIMTPVEQLRTLHDSGHEVVGTPAAGLCAESARFRQEREAGPRAWRARPLRRSGLLDEEARSGAYKARKLRLLCTQTYRMVRSQDGAFWHSHHSPISRIDPSLKSDGEKRRVG
jgi:hypothetical protein